jgi:hypothetical protein
MPDDNAEEPIVGTLILKVPFFVIGVAMGMAVVWLALMWVPDAAEPILRAIRAG